MMTPKETKEQLRAIAAAIGARYLDSDREHGTAYAEIVVGAFISLFRTDDDTFSAKDFRSAVLRLSKLGDKR